jgi:HK97 family phage major capsid protein
MSLQVALKQTREKLAKHVNDMRDLGLEITKLSEAGDEAAAREKDEAFKKMTVDLTAFKEREQNMLAAIEAEKNANALVNDIAVADPADVKLKDADGNGKVDGVDREVLRTKAVREMMMAYVRHGQDSIPYKQAEQEVLKSVPREQHALLATTGTLGGFLVPEDFKAEIIKNLAGFTVMRQSGIRTEQCSGNVLVYPSIAAGTDPWSTGFAGTWRAEGSQGTDGSAPETQDQPTFGQERIPVHVWQPAAVVLDSSLIEDSAVNLDGILANAIAETRGMDEDYAFLRGTGVGQPRGILDYTLTEVITGSDTAIQYDEFLDFHFTLPAQYRMNAVYYMSSLTYAAILKLKDSTSSPMMYINSQPDRLWGKQVFTTEHMPAIAQNAFPVIFGDPRFYIVAERTDLRVQRLVERFAPNVAFLPTARVGGGIVRTAAFIKHKVSAT